MVALRFAIASHGSRTIFYMQSTFSPAGVAKSPWNLKREKTFRLRLTLYSVLFFFKLMECFFHKAYKIISKQKIFGINCFFTLNQNHEFTVILKTAAVQSVQ